MSRVSPQTIIAVRPIIASDKGELMDFALDAGGDKGRNEAAHVAVAV